MNNIKIIKSFDSYKTYILGVKTKMNIKQLRSLKKFFNMSIIKSNNLYNMDLLRTIKRSYKNE